MKRKIFVVVLPIILVNFLYAQEKIYMPWIEVVNMHNDYSYAVSRLFRTYVNAGDRYELILPPESDSLLRLETVEEARAHAISYGAGYYILGEMNRVGELAILSLTMYRSSDGGKVWNCIEKAYSPEDLDPLLSRIAENLGTGTLQYAKKIDQVTDYESRAYRRKDANTSFGVMIGGGTTFVSGISHNFPAGFGVLWQYDVRSMLLDLSGELYFSDINLFQLGIHGWVPFSRTSSTWFAGGGLNYGGFVIENQSNDEDYYYEDHEKAGLIFSAGGGYLFNRDASVSLRVTAKILIPTFKVGSYYPAGAVVGLALVF